ncbi:hypothetical protein GCM10022223_20790 [Kineosporia mesophila]|uniref:Lipoprotein n=1 Tax=Kineosporia mesophila TaxID=566012 RepID=A0ABP6ZDT5_9ACTN
MSHGGRPSQTPRHHSPTQSNGRVPGRLGKNPVKRVALVASFLTLPVFLSGCSTEWASMSPSLTVKKPAAASVVHTPATTATATPSPAVTTTSVNPFATGELADGSAKHRQSAGDHSLVVNYWTDGSDTEVHLSAELKGADSLHTVKVTRFAATLENSDGSTVSLADDQGEFVLTPPYSYTSALAIPTATDTGDRTIDVRFDLLVETEPGSGAFYRQTVLDTVALNVSSSSEAASEGASQ